MLKVYQRRKSAWILKEIQEVPFWIHKSNTNFANRFDEVKTFIEDWNARSPNKIVVKWDQKVKYKDEVKNARKIRGPKGIYTSVRSAAQLEGVTEGTIRNRLASKADNGWRFATEEDIKTQPLIQSN